MYLTRIRLDPTKRSTMRAFAEPKLFHGAIERSFSGERHRNLWRIDTLNGVQYLMLVSEEKPDLNAAVEQFGYPEASAPWETRNYTPLLNRIRPGTRWYFRLTANPTKHTSGSITAGRRGKVIPHVTAEYQQRWLMEKAPLYGFSLTEGEFLAVQEQWYHFRKYQDGGQAVSLLSVTFEGMLTITDVDLFRRTLIEGIGRGKAYGMGMLTIVRVEETT